MDIHNIPLPNELPKSPDLSHLPQEVLESKVVESLVSQNEDLMARLSISLRRFLELEQRHKESGKQNRELQRLNERLNDQVLILKEKFKLHCEKQDQSAERIKDLETKLKELQSQHSTSQLAWRNQQEVLQNAEANIKQVLASSEENFGKKLRRFERYRNRVQKYVAPLLIELKGQFLDLIDDSEKMKTQWYEERKRLEKRLRLHESYIRRIRRWIIPLVHSCKQQLVDLTVDKTQIEAEFAHLQNQLRSHDEKADVQRTMIANLTSQIKNLEIQAKTLTEERDSACKQAKCDSEALKAQEMTIFALENKVIQETRRSQEKSLIWQKEVEGLQEIISISKKEKEQHHSNSADLKDKLILLEKLNSDNKIRADRFESENESLKALWNSQRQKLEELQLKEDSLQALNSDLLTKLKEDRDSQQKLQAQMAIIESNYQKKLEELKNQINFLNSQVPVKTTESSGLDKKQMEKLEKMEILISEIQTGFKRKGSVVTAALPDHDIK